MTQTTIRLNVNGQSYEITARPDRFLVDLLREDMGIMDVKEACEEGECGSCTVLIDGEALDSCIYLAAQCDGRQVTTASGLSLRRNAVVAAARLCPSGGGAVRLRHAWVRCRGRGAAA